LWLRLTNAVKVGSADPVFGRDLGFYLFQLPALQFLWLYVFVVGCLALVTVFIIYGQENEFEISGSTTALSPWALRHMAALGAALLVWKAVGYQLVSYNLLLSQRGSVFGIGYTDFYLRLPLLKVMMLIALLCAGLLWWWSRRNDVRRVALTIGGYLAASTVLLVIVPGLFQHLSVEPNDGREARFMDWQVAGTKRAYGLDLLDSRRNWNRAAPSRSGVQDVTNAADGLPLWRRDALLQVLNEMFEETPGHFADVDLDRYRIGDEMRPVFVAARELMPLSGTVTLRPGGILRPATGVVPESQTSPAQVSASWIDRHLHQTHGAGMLICDANRTDAMGRPLIYKAETIAAQSKRDVVPSTRNGLSPLLRVAHPEIFFGEFPLYRPLLPQALRSQTSLSRVASPSLASGSSLEAGQRSSLPEIGGAAMPGAPVSVASPVPAVPYVVVDTPSNAAPGAATQYSGKAGVSIRTKWRQWLLAWRFHDVRLALSHSVHEQSRVLWHRRVVERCRNIAPFLSFIDSDPYPVLTESGRIVWMLDIYSTSDSYPYSEPADAATGWNYLRGAVNATVDAYDGTVRFYIADSGDAMVQCYARAFPELFQPLSAMPEELRRHARYPAAALHAQSRIWTRLRQLKSPELLREVTTAPNYVLLPEAVSLEKTSTEYSTHTEKSRADFSSSGVFATSFVMTAHETERPGTVAELDFSRHVTSGLLADGRYDGPHADVPLSQRLWLWTPKTQTVPAIVRHSPTPTARPRQIARRVDSVMRTHTSALPLGDTLLAMQSQWESSHGRKPLLKEVAFQWNGQAVRAASFDIALRELRSSALLATMSQPVATATKPRAVPRPAEVLERARAQFDAMQRARRVNNWPAYGVAEKKLGELLRSQ
jgi:uncharacterized membrane protein (UPF0182 family)